MFRVPAQGRLQEARLVIAIGWHSLRHPVRGAHLSGVHIQVLATSLDDRCGGVGGSAVLRAIRAVSSASHTRALAL
jgi:hypothetical protein